MAVDPAVYFYSMGSGIREMGEAEIEAFVGVCCGASAAGGRIDKWVGCAKVEP